MKTVAGHGKERRKASGLGLVRTAIGPKFMAWFGLALVGWNWASIWTVLGLQNKFQMGPNWAFGLGS